LRLMTGSTEHGRFRRDVAAIIFVCLLGSYAYFWQARCWNSASRLMLTYAIGDRWTLSIDGLQDQTRDRAFVNGHYYSDKAPGQSLLAVPIYLLLRLISPSHPLDRPPMPYWWPDYVLTVLTSGIATAALGVLIYTTANWLGCSQWTASVMALAYGLGTPAFIYATLFYGHQPAAFCAFLCFLLLYRNARRDHWPVGSMFAAGLLAGYAVLTEYPLVFTSLVLMAYGFCASRQFRAMIPFCSAAAMCALVLAGYNLAAFGNPLELGYFSETEPQFRAVYSESNPIGLNRPTLAAAVGIFWGARGLLLYAPITLLAIAGLMALAWRREWALALVVIGSFGSMYLINASHPTWTGGFATGPRYVLPGLPFLMPAVAAAVAGRRRWPGILAAGLGAIGFVIVLACTARGGRLPDVDTPGGDNPLLEDVIPAWRDGLFDRNVGKLILYPWWWELAPRWKWIAFVPLLVFQATMVALLFKRCNYSSRDGP
jgi:hypothetical protein